MRTIHRYIAVNLLVSIVFTFIVFTFVMSVGIFIKATDLLARGVSWVPLFRIVVCGLPGALAFSIPLSVLTSSLLVFSRLSADGEITALRASGVSLWQILRTPLLLGVFFSLLCAFLHAEIAPNSHFARRSLRSELGVESPVELLVEGRFIRDFPGVVMYIGRRRGLRLENIRIYDLRTRGVQRQIAAASGEILTNTGPSDLVIDLYDVRVDPFSDDRPGALTARKWPVRVEDALVRRTYEKREKDLTLLELWAAKREWVAGAGWSAVDEIRQRMVYAVEFHKRLALSASCLAFVFLGIPLGIRSHRKESSIGVALGLVFVFNFYLFIILAESMRGRPEWRPDLIVWAPVLISMILGWALIRRAG